MGRFALLPAVGRRLRGGPCGRLRPAGRRLGHGAALGGGGSTAGIRRLLRRLGRRRLRFGGGLLFGLGLRLAAVAGEVQRGGGAERPLGGDAAVLRHPVVGRAVLYGVALGIVVQGFLRQLIAGVLRQAGELQALAVAEGEAVFPAGPVGVVPVPRPFGGRQVGDGAAVGVLQAQRKVPGPGRVAQIARHGLADAERVAGERRQQHAVLPVACPRSRVHAAPAGPAVQGDPVGGVRQHDEAGVEAVIVVAAGQEAQPVGAVGTALALDEAAVGSGAGYVGRGDRPVQNLNLLGEVAVAPGLKQRGVVGLPLAADVDVAHGKAEAAAHGVAPLAHDADVHGLQQPDVHLVVVGGADGPAAGAGGPALVDAAVAQIVLGLLRRREDVDVRIGDEHVGVGPVGQPGRVGV